MSSWFHLNVHNVDFQMILVTALLCSDGARLLQCPRCLILDDAGGYSRCQALPLSSLLLHLGLTSQHRFLGCVLGCIFPRCFPMNANNGRIPFMKRVNSTQFHQFEAVQCAFFTAFTLSIKFMLQCRILKDTFMLLLTE